MKGNTFTTPEGETHKVLDFDEVNKMAYINVEGGQYKWVHENEYCTWVVNDTAKMPKVYVPDVPAQMVEEPKEETPVEVKDEKVKPIKEPKVKKEK